MKYCSMCSIYRKLNEFYRNCTSKDGYMSVCKYCDKTRTQVFSTKKLRKICLLESLKKWEPNGKIVSTKESKWLQGHDGKWCPKCRRVLTLNSFTSRQRCVECSNKRNRKANAERSRKHVNLPNLESIQNWNPDGKIRKLQVAYLRTNGYKWCPSCLSVLFVEDFQMNSSRSDNLSSYCSACLSIKNKNRRNTDPHYRLLKNVRRRINLAIQKGGYTKDSSLVVHIGLPYNELLDYLTNYGSIKYDSNIHHVDHICPCSQARNKKELLKLQYYTNLQILKIKVNLTKGAHKTVEAENMCSKLLGRPWDE